MKRYLLFKESWNQIVSIFSFNAHDLYKLFLYKMYFINIYKKKKYRYSENIYLSLCSLQETFYCSFNLHPTSYGKYHSEFWIIWKILSIFINRNTQHRRQNTAFYALEWKTIHSFTAIFSHIGNWDSRVCQSFQNSWFSRIIGG